MQMTFFRSTGWAGWDVTAEPAIPDRMPVLVDDDLLFEDAGVARPSVAASRRLRELPVSGAPSPATWAAYARVLVGAENLCHLGVSNGTRSVPVKRSASAELVLAPPEAG
jgi:hypothetical protein